MTRGINQRLMAFVEDNLLHRDSGRHEDMIENLVVLTWLTHSKLPKLVKQMYGTEFADRTITFSVSAPFCPLLTELSLQRHGKLLAH